jgi:hypothetical protein
MVGWDGTEYWRCMGNYFVRFSALFWLLGFVARVWDERDERDEQDEITVCVWTSGVEMKVQSAREDVLLLRQWNFLLQAMGHLCWSCGFTARIETWDEVCLNPFILRNHYLLNWNISASTVSSSLSDNHQITIFFVPNKPEPIRNRSSPNATNMLKRLKE